MKKRTSSCILLFVFFILFLGASKEGYGQRVYANLQQSSPGVLLSSVTNQNYAIDLPDTSNYSTLNVALGLLGLVTAHQNLQFSTDRSPSKSSPIMIKIGTQSSILDLLGGISIQRTYGGRTSLVPPNYSSSQLLNLLNLFGGSKTGIVVVPQDGTIYDGVRLEVNTLLGVALTAYNYYAFYIAPPKLSSETLTFCEGESSSIAISNYQDDYTYRLYDVESGGTSINSTTTNTISFSSTDEGVFWLEAREGDLYPSARVKITITRNKISNNTISANQSICQGDLPMAITGVIPATAGATVSYQWQSKTSGSFTNISGAIFQNYQPSGLSLATTFRRVVNATLNGKTCTSISNEVTVNIKPRPPAPQIIFKPNSQY